MAEIASAVDYWNMFLDLTITAGAREVGRSSIRREPFSFLLGEEKKWHYDVWWIGAWK